MKKLLPLVVGLLGAVLVFALALDGDQGLDLALANKTNATGPTLINPSANSDICGDANGDSVVNSSDIVSLIYYLFYDGPAPDCTPNTACGDVNGDDWVDCGELFYLNSYLYAEGPAPIGSPGSCTSPYPDTFDLDAGIRDTLRIVTVEATPGEDLEIPIMCYNDDSLCGFIIALKVPDQSQVSLDSVSWLNSKAEHVGSRRVNLTPDSALFSALVALGEQQISPGTGLLATLWGHVEPSGPPGGEVTLEIIDWQPGRPPRFYTKTEHYWGYEPWFTEATIEVLTSHGYRPVHYNFMQMDTTNGDSVRILLDLGTPPDLIDSVRVYWALDYYVPVDSFENITDSFPDLHSNYADTANLMLHAGNVHFRVLVFQSSDTLIHKHVIMLIYDDPEWPVMSVTDEEKAIVGSGEGQMVAGNEIILFKDSVVTNWGTPDSADLAMTAFFRENELMPIGTCRDLNFVLTYTFDETFPVSDTAALQALAEALYTDNSDILDEASPNRIFQPGDLTVTTEDIPKETRDNFHEKTAAGKPEGNFKSPGDNVLANSFHLFITEAYAGHRLARKAANLGAVTDVWLAVLDGGLGNGALPIPSIANARIKKPTAIDPVTNRPKSYADNALDKVKDDVDSHGTNVSVTAVGDGESNGGVIRGGGPDVILMPFKDAAADYADIIAFLDFIRTKVPKVKVINMSNGLWYVKPPGTNNDGKSLTKAIKRICANDRIVAVASDNDDDDITNRASDGKIYLPGSLAPTGKRVADFSTLLTVASTDGTDGNDNGISLPRPTFRERRVTWCGYGDPISLAATGQDIRVQERNGTLAVTSGCSFATPQAAGLIGEMMMLDKALGAPDFSPQQIVEIVESTADPTINDAAPFSTGEPTAPNKWVGHGRISIWKALLAIANGGIAFWDANYANVFGALGAGNVKNDANTIWYGFRIHTKEQNATPWLHGSLTTTQIQDAGNTQLIGNVGGNPGLPLGDALTYKGVQREANCPWSLPFGFTHMGAIKKDFLALFTIKRENLQDPGGGFQTLQWRKRGDNAAKIPILIYPKSGGLNLAAMRGATPPKGCTFDNFIFTIDPIKVVIEKKKKKQEKFLTRDADMLDLYFDLEISNPDTIRRDTVIISAEAFKNDTTLGFLLDTTEVSIPPGDTLIAESLHVYLPDGIEFGDTVSVIATLEPLTGDYIVRDIHYEALLIRGDANGDGVINSADVVYLINYLFKDGPPPDPLEAGDVNCDEIINSADVVYLINYLFKGGPPPGC